MKDLCNSNVTSNGSQMVASPSSSSPSTPNISSKPPSSSSSLSTGATAATKVLTSSINNGVKSTGSIATNIATNQDYEEDDMVEYMEVEEDGQEEDSSSASSEYDLSPIPQWMRRPIRLNDHWYVIDKKWFDQLLDYIYDSNSPRPPKLDNSALLSPVKNNAQKNYAEPMFRLKPNLAEDIDYVVAPEEVWDLVLKAFGIVDGIGGHHIRCPVLQQGLAKYLTVEIYPLEVRLALYGSKDDMVAQYSKNTTLKEIISDMRRLFRVDESTPVQLWNNAQLLVSHTSTGNNNNSTSSSSSSSNTNSSTYLPNSCSSLTNGPSSAIPLPPPPPSPSPSSLMYSRPSTTSPVNELEQSLLDLDLSPNSVLTLEPQNNDGTWPSSRTKAGAITRSRVASGVPITTPGLCGLMNLGNTCFMNAALQCLSNTPPLTEFLLSDRYLADINTENPLGMRGEIAIRYSELIKLMWSGHHTAFPPREFKVAVSRFAPQFSGFAQHDCQELMAFLLDGLHEDLNRVRKKPYIEIKNDIERRPDEEVAAEAWHNYKLRNDSIIVDTFQSQLKSTLVCPECQLVSVTFDPMGYLTLPLPVKRERAVDITFVPATRKRPTHLICSKSETFPSLVPLIKDPTSGMMSVEIHSILIEGLMIPKHGYAWEICEAVAKLFNQSRSKNGVLVLERTLDPEKLLVASVFDKRLSKIYSSKDMYDMHLETIVVYEIDDQPLVDSTDASPASSGTDNSSKSSKQKPNQVYSLPVLLRELNPLTGAKLLSRPFLLTVKDVTYEEIRDAMLEYLTTLIHFQLDENLRSALNEEESIEKRASRSQTNKRNPTLRDGSDGEGTDEEEEDQYNTGVGSELNDLDEQDDIYAASSKKVYVPPYSITTSDRTGHTDYTLLAPGTKLETDQSTTLVLNLHSKIVKKFLPSNINNFHQIKLTQMTNPSEGATTNLGRRIVTLDDCIKQFTLLEKLGAEDPWYCPRCKKHQMASKKFDIWSLPEVLIIHLKRFSYSRITRDKIDALVEFPVCNLDMTPYVCNNPDDEPLLYNLIGVANHMGGLGGGHYTAYAKNKITNSWYHFDDSSISPITNEKTVVTKSAYVLFYQRQQSSSSSLSSSTANNNNSDTTKSTSDSS